MAAIIRNGYPVVHSAIVNEDTGLAGGEFVTYTPSTGKVAKKASGYDEYTYVTINVEHDPNKVGDDATAVVPKGGYIKMVHCNPGDEITITGLTSVAVGDTVRDAFVIVGTGLLHGVAAHHLRCIKSDAAAAADAAGGDSLGA